MKREMLEEFICGEEPQIFREYISNPIMKELFEKNILGVPTDEETGIHYEDILILAEESVADIYELYKNNFDSTEISNKSSDKVGSPTVSQNLNENQWEPLPIDRDSPLIQQAQQSVEALEKVVREDNGLSVTEPAFREGMLIALSDAKLCLNSELTTKHQIFHRVFEPVKAILMKFGVGLINAAARTAWEHLLLAFSSVNPPHSH